LPWLQRHIDRVIGSAEVFKSLGWIDVGHSWTWPSTLTKESAVAGAASIQAKIESLKVWK
jgi:hypothetical protein